MGGRVAVESREGLGTRFSLSLPIAEAVRLLAEHASPHSPPQIPSQEVA
jgi:chemotaxis protein histidine kinase CheA